MQKTWIRNYGVLLFCAAAVSTPGFARAQAIAPLEPVEETEELRRYTVEMIIFEYAGNTNDSNEMFIAEPVDVPTLDESDDGPIYTDIPQLPPRAGDAAKMSIEEIPSLRQVEMSLLEPGKYTMSDIYKKLEKLDAYNPVMHTAWTQTAVARELSPPVRLRRLGDAPLRLDGELTLYVSRFLHLVVDLQLDAEEPGYLPSDEAGIRPPAKPFGESAYAESEKPDLRPTRLHYRISEDRIFRNGDLRYFDHPKFGVLVKVTRYDPATDERDAAGSMPGGIEAP